MRIKKFIFKSSFCRRNNSCMTLLELLIVIALISMLMTLLLPSLRMAKEKANQIACVSNLKQLGIASLNYISDQQGYIPVYIYPDYIWQFQLSEYMKLYSNKAEISVWTCPTAFAVHPYKGTYAWNSNLIGYQLKKFSSVKKPSSGILFTIGNWSSTGEYFSATINYTTFPSLTQYHNDGLNYCFLDGNVQWIKYSDVTNNLWYGN